MAVQGGIRFSVHDEGQEILVYHFPDLRAATEHFAFIREFFPNAKFLFEPALH